jgi:hypothetical protein
MISPTTGAATGRLAEAVAEATGAAVPTQTAPPAPRTGIPDGVLEALAAAAAPALVRAVRAGIAAATRGTTPVAGYAPAAGTKRSSSSAAKGPLDFLRDPKLSIEEKLMRLLSYLNEKWEKEMQAKLDEMGTGEGGTASSSSKGGLLKGVESAFSKALGGSGLAGAALSALKIPGVRAALEKIGGPVLGAAASAMGFPAAAPALIKYGGSIVGAAADLASSLGETQASTSGTGGKAMSDAKRQQLTLEIQRLYEKQKEMFTLVSNIMRVSHETRSAVIGNIR